MIGLFDLFFQRGLLNANKEPAKYDLDVSNEKLPMKMREAIELKKKIEERLRQGSKMTKAKSDKDQFVKGGKSKRQRKLVGELMQNKPDERGAEVPVRKYDSFKKQDHESEAHFLNRIERVRFFRLRLIPKFQLLLVLNDCYVKL